MLEMVIGLVAAIIVLVPAFAIAQRRQEVRHLKTLRLRDRARDIREEYTRQCEGKLLVLEAENKLLHSGDYPIEVVNVSREMVRLGARQYIGGYGVEEASLSVRRLLLEQAGLFINWKYFENSVAGSLLVVKQHD